MILGTIHSVRESVINNTGFATEAPIRNTPVFIPTLELVFGTVTYLIIIAMTVAGNIMVVVAVFTYRPLKKVQNYFLVSLAVSDLCVAIFVMPLHVVKFLANGRWLMGVTICQLFTTADILLCTSSILNLCAIAIDRYCAIHDPINYAQRRTPRFVCGVIAIVWVLSVIISVPPLIGWNDWSSQKLRDHCELSSERAFVVFSASGSFFLPLLVMIIVYLKIFLSARQRIRKNRGRSALMRIQTTPPDVDERRRRMKRYSSEDEKSNNRSGEQTRLVHKSDKVAKAFDSNSSVRRLESKYMSLQNHTKPKENEEEVASYLLDRTVFFDLKQFCICRPSTKICSNSNRY
ncbi:unnamed protein product [Cylicocyclus nassatus]|uniref:G-protein coupled receptors family 1 profile domain-containing protein n=1 Tax=Cylicocyclus nassatus TaxID=53992 RepID=A0AA36HFA2_CYLNA|nr:unnamed protein product [Cylicocyclus nassatus]